MLLGKRPYYVILFSIFLLFGTFQLNQFFPPKVLYFPENRPNYINVFIELPVGTDIEETNRFTKKLEESIDFQEKYWHFLTKEPHFIQLPFIPL